MDTMDACRKGEMNRDKESMVFDWDKAAREIKKRKAKDAYAGLKDDWEWTGGQILKDGKPYYDDYTFLSSTWAIPELKIDNETIYCYKMQSELPKQNQDTKWTKKSLEILKTKGE